jgi:hypothetical protein
MGKTRAGLGFRRVGASAAPPRPGRTKGRGLVFDLKQGLFVEHVRVAEPLIVALKIDNTLYENDEMHE